MKEYKKRKVINYLVTTGKGLTVDECSRTFHCTELRKIISDLVKKPEYIVTKVEEPNTDVGSHKRYYVQRIDG